MTEPDARPASEPAARGRLRPRRILAWVGVALLAVIALVLAAAALLDTGPGRGLVADEISRLKLASGLSVRVGRIEGSIYGRMVLHDVVVSDLRGPFVRSPALTVDWRPLPFLISRRLVLRELSAGTIDVLRRPALKPAVPKPNHPLLPAVDITVGKLRVGALVLEPPVAGAVRRLTISGSADLVRRRALLSLAAASLPTPRQPGGDRLAVRLDSEPEHNRLVIDAHAYGPADGAIAGLVGVKSPVALDLSGQGAWRLWRGRLDATLGGRSLIGADLSEASGAYAAKGQAAPGLLLKGAVAKLADPSMAFDLAWSMPRPRLLQLRGRVASPEVSLTLAGGVALSDNSFRKMQVRLRLTRPQALAPSLSGTDVGAVLALDGPMARPRVDYELAARSLGFGKDALEALKASGRIQLGTGERLQLLVHATAARLTGPGKLPGAVEAIRLDGRVAGSWTGAAKGRIDLRSTGLNLAADVSGSTRTNRYAVQAKGRLEAAAVRAFGLEAVLGGPADFAADLAEAPGVTVQIRSLQLSAPELKVTRASGELKSDGALALDAAAETARYGPITLTAAGTLKAPTAHLTAAHPRIGIQLANLDARLSKPGPAYEITASAGSPYGPLAADFALSLQPVMAVDIRHASLGGLGVAGRLERTAAGPFAGQLQLSGDGLTGRLLLSAAGAVQQADVSARASHARLPLKPEVTLAAGVISGRAVLTPHAPTITAHADLTGLQRGGLQLAAARADLQLRGGSGRAAISARGTEAQPFELASTAAISPGVFSIDARGSANRLAFRLLQPARIVKAAGAWRLEPATLVLPGGRIDASGSYGNGLALSLRLQQVDLGMSQAFAPSLGIGGTASGSIDLSLPKGASAPEGHAQLQLTGLTRSGLTTVSEPVDVNLLGSLAARDGEVNAVVRRRGAVVGRLQARLIPAAAGADWMARLRAGTLSGGVRYDGPSEALWALSGVAGQEVSGPIAIGADVSGRVDAPQLRGVIHANDLRFQDTKYGTRIDDLAIQGSFAGTRLQLDSLTGKAGAGTVSASGYADLSLANGLPVDLKLSLDKAQLAKSSDLSAALTGKLEVTNSKAGGGRISGALAVNNARYVVARQGGAQVVTLQGVHIKGQPIEAETSGGPELPISRWKLDVRLRADNQIFVDGMGLNSEWRADLRVTGDVHHPMVTGDITAIRGTYSFGGRQLRLTDGLIHLNGSSPPDPTLAITASSTVNDVTATINVAGTAQEPQITFTSTPALPQDEVLSRLLFGAATPQLSPLQAVQLAASLNALRGGHGLDPLGKLRQAIGVQNLTFTAGASASGTGNAAGIGVGKYISSRIYVQVSTDTRGYAATQVQVALTKTLNLLSQVSSLGTSNLSLQYSHRY